MHSEQPHSNLFRFVDHVSVDYNYTDRDYSANLTYGELERAFSRKTGSILDERCSITDDDGASIINDVSSKTDTISVHHFFTYNNEETVMDVLRHIVHELLSQPHAVSRMATDVCKKKAAHNASPLFKNLTGIICELAKKIGRVCIVMDGLDEFS